MFFGGFGCVLLQGGFLSMCQSVEEGGRVGQFGFVGENVELVFVGTKPELEKFTIKNENGSSTSISLKDIEYPKKLNETLFSIALETKKRRGKN